MGIIVQKYGGKLVADCNKMQKVADIIASNADKGNKVVAVVSAMGDTTDELNKKIMEITQNPNKREVDVVLSSGEQIAMGLLSIMLNDMGYSSISLSGWQAGILTDNTYTNSNIIQIDTNIINHYFESNDIVIVAGFQGIDNENNITTLGRGGSDTTATELAVNLKADVCEIYKDTKCIFTADPKIVPTAKKLDHINYDNMLELAQMGAKVLAVKSIEYAMRHDLNLVIKSVDDDEIGTVINKRANDIFFPIISCTRKEYNSHLDVITFIINTNCSNSKELLPIVEATLEANGIKEYEIADTKTKIAIILENTFSQTILKQLHDKFIL